VDALPTLQDDGLVTPDVGVWAEEKYQLVRYYADIFSSAMTGKFTLVYADLFAGAGRAILRSSGRIIPASPLLVLDVRKPFSRYVFSELDAAKTEALRERLRATAPDRDTHVIDGDTNENVRRVLDLIPKRSLTFCFADPFNIENLRFRTIETLATNRKVDFLVLLPTGMDPNRNEATYAKASNEVVEHFTGARDWRTRWPHDRLGFGDFVADEFGRSMQRLGYIYDDGLAATRAIVNSRHAVLYRLAFFSTNALGMKFWYDSIKYTNPQRSLF
jgi:three-Cys-motif partner protein